MIQVTSNKNQLNYIYNLIGFLLLNIILLNQLITWKIKIMLKFKRIKPSNDIIKDCFWDYKINLDDIENYSNSKDFRIQNFLFEKILWNSQNLLKDLMVFKKKDLKKICSNYKVPNFNKSFIDLRYRIVKQLLLNDKVSIPELEWRI